MHIIIFYQQKRRISEYTLLTSKHRKDREYSQTIHLHKNQVIPDMSYPSIQIHDQTTWDYTCVKFA